MITYILRRLAWLLPIALLAATFVFLITSVLPGNVAMLILGGEGGAPSPEAIARLEAELGLDLPLHVRYLTWVWDALRFDFGNSLWTGQPVLRQLELRIPVSVTLVLLALSISVVVSVPLGILAATHQDSWIDYAARSFAILGLSMPGFVLAALAVIALMVWFKWSVPLEYANLGTNPLVALQQLIGPALILALRTMGVETRMMRSCMLEVLREDYVRTARAKGLTERAVIWIHALKNSILPVITSFSVEIVVFFSGAVVIETLFNVQGLGSFIEVALRRRDIPVIQGVLVVIVVFVILVNLLVDVIHAWLDPRVRQH